jgi:hypothetical protein
VTITLIANDNPVVPAFAGVTNIPSRAENCFEGVGGHRRANPGTPAAPGGKPRYPVAGGIPRVFQLILGIGVTVFTIGGLTAASNVDQGDLMPQPVEALIIGVIFMLSAVPRGWALAFRALMPLPTFLIYLRILTGRQPAMPFDAAFFCALVYSLFLTAYTAYLAERGRMPQPP